MFASLPTPLDLKDYYPLSSKQKAFVSHCRARAHQLIRAPDQLVLIVGPCSIYDIEATITYAKLLSTLAKEVATSCHLVMRVYLEKPRTISGWKGFVYQPDIHSPSDLYKGLVLSRKLLLTLIDLELPLAMEFVDPLMAYYFDDLISWGCIGARTCASQTHRQLTSYLQFPVGFKNSIDGNIEIAIQGMLASSVPQTFFALSPYGRPISLTSQGNASTFLILRGGETSTNCDIDSLSTAYKQEASYGLTSPILIDCSHGNSKKNLERQRQNFLDIVDYKLASKLPLLGMMLESFLEEGDQSITSTINPNISITDPCLSWETTKHLILWAHQLLSHQPLHAHH